MATRSEFAVPLDRSETRSSHSVNPKKQSSTSRAMSDTDEVCLSCFGNSDVMCSRTTVDRGTFLIGLARSTNGTPGKERK